jgi:arylsulfatase
MSDSSASDTTDQPNVVLVMLDDLGFADIEPYGGEIATPNLQGLAEDGLRFTQFYNTGRCCPTRASLLTGLHPHQAGIGHMTNQYGDDRCDRGVPGYRGHLNDRCTTLAEVLGDAGYDTLCSGKWHVGANRLEDRPTRRGFDRFYGVLDGATNYFDPNCIEDGDRGLSTGADPPGTTPAESTTERPYYLTDAITDHGIDFVDQSLEAGGEDPFFLYLPYTAPHWPLQAPERLVEKYRGEYTDGWETLRAERYQRQLDMGLFEEDWAPLSEPAGPDWDSLSPEQRDEMDYRMAVYAAQVESVDRNLGRLVEALQERDEFENTLFLFFSDNGGCHEGGMLGGGDREQVNDPAEYGIVSYGEAWANVSNTPFRKYKSWAHEGGIATPLIVHWPEGLDDPGGAWRRQPSSLPDIMATLVDLTGAEYPDEREGVPIPGMEGVSLAPAFDNNPLRRDRPMCMEHQGNRCLRDGRWKLVSEGSRDDYGGTDTWTLHDMSEDRSETIDVGDRHPDVVADLSDQWWVWAERVGAVPNGKGVKRRTDVRG